MTLSADAQAPASCIVEGEAPITTSSSPTVILGQPDFGSDDGSDDEVTREDTVMLASGHGHRESVSDELFDSVTHANDSEKCPSPTQSVGEDTHMSLGSDVHITDGSDDEAVNSNCKQSNLLPPKTSLTSGDDVMCTLKRLERMTSSIVSGTY